MDRRGTFVQYKPSLESKLETRVSLLGKILCDEQVFQRTSQIAKTECVPARFQLRRFNPLTGQHELLRHLAEGKPRRKMRVPGRTLAVPAPTPGLS